MVLFVEVGDQVLFRFPTRRAAYAFVLAALSTADRATVAAVRAWSLRRGEGTAAKQLPPPGRLAHDVRAWAAGGRLGPLPDDG